MKASEFKNLIKEAVREALKEELVTIAQQPIQEATPVAYIRTGNTIADMLAETKASMATTDFKSLAGLDSSMAQNFNRGMLMPKQNFNPTSTNPEVIARTIAHAPKMGLDISQLSFVSKAAAIVSATDKKQKEKYGI